MGDLLRDGRQRFCCLYLGSAYYSETSGRIRGLFISEKRGVNSNGSHDLMVIERKKEQENLLPSISCADSLEKMRGVYI